MKKKVHIIIAPENGTARALVVRKGSLLTSAIVAVSLLLLFVTSLWVAGNALLDRGAQLEQVAQLETSAQRLATQNKRLMAQVERYRLDKKQQVRDAVTLLNERSTQLESILTKVGVTVPSDGDDNLNVAQDSDTVSGTGSGGPFIADVSGSDTNDTDSLLIYSEQLRSLAARVPLGLPTQGYLSSGFGRRVDPINGKKAFHSGIDIANNLGTEIHATADGTVISCGPVCGYGNMVKVANGDNFSTVFGHLDKIVVKKGAHVARGDVIGTMGNTGRSTGTHLHYEIRDHGRAINPYSFTFLQR